MLPVERRAHSDLRRGKGCANIEEMAEKFDVSQMTIRRDIRTLEQEDKLRVTYGGAVSKSFLMEDIPYEKKNAVNIEEKKSIAYEALKLVKEGQIVLLDAGTSTMALAKLLMRMKVTVITPDLKIALQLSDSSTAKVYTTGVWSAPLPRLTVILPPCLSWTALMPILPFWPPTAGVWSTV